MTKLWISTAVSPDGNPFGTVAVIAETKTEAIAKARVALQKTSSNYVPAQEYQQNLLDHLDDMEAVGEGVYIDWQPIEKRR
jgi:biotin carboxylase